jgi:microcin C transport system substrate-binding protein
MPSGTPLHGLSAFGELKYPADFDHFDYVNAGAPKGGTFNFSPANWAYNQNTQTFNTLNSFVRKGDSPPRMEMCHDSLMVRALDEPDAVYGLLAESVTLSDDRNTYEFRLRENARFNDGTPVTGEDVAFSFVTFKEEGHPELLLPLAYLKEAAATGDHSVRLVFDGEQSERTIANVVVFPIISKAFYEEYPFDGSELRAPLGSGPYKVSKVSAGQSIEFERVEDYWAADLPVVRGRYNFDILRIDFYRERQTAFEAFKKGNVHYREEFTSKTWATEYDFPALNEGRVVKREFPEELNPSMQAWAMNRRRPIFKDNRVIEAVDLCFDFEWTRTNLFYGSYIRSESLFERSEFKAEGPASAEEKALIETLPGELPDGITSEPVMQPVSDGSGRDRSLLRKAVTLLSQAGWRKPGADAKPFLVNADGNRLSLEFMVQSEVFIRVYTPFIENMRAIGIDASVRLVDPAQFQARMDDFDFDVVGVAYSIPATPTRHDLEIMFSSKAAVQNGSRNLPGTSDPAVDAVIDAVGKAETRKELVTAMRVLDRLLRARRDWIPNWYAATHRVAFWDMFGFKEPKPDYGFPVEDIWWFDAEQARAIGKI